MSELEKSSDSKMTFEISAAHFDNTLETVLGVAVCGIFFAALWIVSILIEIESSKVSFFSVDKDLEFNVEEEKKEGEPGTLEVEVPGRANKEAPAQEIRSRRGRRVTCGFKMMQLGSVMILILLTYLLLVATNAPIYLSAIGSIAVFCIFLRYQIGDEIRRQRWDRLLLLLSLFLMIAAFLNLTTYTYKSLAQGEVYMGPARIVHYDQQPYNNSNPRDPATRTDIRVEWGKAWGCPLTGGRVCEANVQGVMCAVKPEGDDDLGGGRKLTGWSKDKNSTSHHNNNGHNGHNSTGHNGHHNNNETTTELKKENTDLEKENEELQKEVDELEEKNKEEEDEAEDTEAFVEEEMVGDEMEDEKEIIDMEEEVDEAEADEDEMEEEMDKAEIKDEEKDANDDSVKKELDKDVEMLDEEEDETENQLDEELDEDNELEDEYDEAASEYFDAADEELDEVIDEMESVEDIDEDIEDTKEEVDKTKEELGQNVTDDMYYDELNLEYDDDLYDGSYWDYDWDSAWGDYGCTDLFDNDVAGKAYDANQPAGGDDDWPFINIYGSCKTCDAYVLDYFAEQSFEKFDDYFLNAVVYLGLASAGMLMSMVGFIKYKLEPPAENELSLMGSDGGVMA